MSLAEAEVFDLALMLEQLANDAYIKHNLKAEGVDYTAFAVGFGVGVLESYAELQRQAALEDSNH